MNLRPDPPTFSSIYRESVTQIMDLLPSDLSAIAKHNAAAKPLGWPCAPFKHRTKVVALAKDTLDYNG